MLMTTTLFDAEETHLAMRVGLERSFTIIGVERRGLLYDGAFAPVSRAPSRDRTAFHILLRGYFQTSTGLCAEGPALFRLQEDVLEGADGARSATVRTWGEPHELLAIHVSPEWVRGERRAPPQFFPLDPELERYARQLIDCFATRRLPSEQSCASYRVVRRLGELGFVDPAISTNLGVGEGYGERLWSGLSTFFANMDTAPSLTMLTDLAAVSPRHADRLLARFTRAYGLPDEGFRDITRRWRLKLATLLLSSRSLSVERVARRVGYRGSEALANAMAAEGLLPPSRYRRLWDFEPGGLVDGRNS